MPERVQMHRRKGGWRKDHPDAVIVARPTKWGNPFTLEHHPFAGFVALAIDGPRGARTQREWRRAAVVKVFSDWIWLPEQAALRSAAAAELRGRDLACWCPLDQPCHADVLLEIANREGDAR